MKLGDLLVKGGQLYAIILVVVFSILFTVTFIRASTKSEDETIMHELNMVIAFTAALISWAFLWVSQRYRLGAQGMGVLALVSIISFIISSLNPKPLPPPSDGKREQFCK